MSIIIAFDEEYADVGRMNDLSEGELATLERSFEEYDVEISYTETAYGTTLMCAREIGAEEDFLSIISVYKGYLIEFVLEPGEGSDGMLTDEQIDTAIAFLSDLDFVPVSDSAVLSGGWAVNNDAPSNVTEEEKAIFDAAMAGAGLDCRPVAVLATQVVAGANYAFLAKEAASTDWTVIVVYNSLDGQSEILKIHPIALGNMLTVIDAPETGLSGGWHVRDGAGEAALPADVWSLFEEAVAPIDVNLTPFALLGSQVVAGMNYKLLAADSGVLYAVNIYQPLDGVAELTSMDPVDLLAYVSPN